MTTAELRGTPAPAHAHPRDSSMTERKSKGSKSRVNFPLSSRPAISRRSIRFGFNRGSAALVMMSTWSTLSPPTSLIEPGPAGYSDLCAEGVTFERLPSGHVPEWCAGALPWVAANRASAAHIQPAEDSCARNPG